MASNVEVPLIQGISCLSELNAMRIAGELRTKPGTATKLAGTAVVAVGGLIPDQSTPTPIGALRLTDEQRTKARQDCEDLQLWAQSVQSDPVGSRLTVLVEWLVAIILEWLNPVAA